MTDIIRGTVKEAISQHALGENVWYDCALNVLIGNEGNPVPIYVVVLSIPSAQIGQRMTSVISVPMEDVTRDKDIEQAVQQAMESLLGARSEMLQQQQSASQVLVGSTV